MDGSEMRKPDVGLDPDGRIGNGRADNGCW